ncbi:MAG: His-Xaa-Ser system protein HxsD [Microgenomates group bacterium]
MTKNIKRLRKLQQKEIKIQNKKDLEIKIILETKIYPLEAIYLSAYNFIDKAYVFLDGDPNDKIIIELKLKPDIKQFKNAKELEKEFMNELIHETLRYQISQENQVLREFIIGTALLGSLSQLKPSEQFFEDVERIKKEIINEIEKNEEKSVEENEENNEIFEDPLGIAIPWEQKFGKQQKTQ